MTTTTEIPADFTPSYSPWRHGGWYVDNIRYPSGAVGCVSRNYADRKWRIVCDTRPGSFPGGADDHTYPNRDAAARAELALALAAQATVHVIEVTEGCTCCQVYTRAGHPAGEECSECGHLNRRHANYTDAKEA